jgi:hypothetical protein
MDRFEDLLERLSQIEQHRIPWTGKALRKVLNDHNLHSFELEFDEEQRRFDIIFNDEKEEFIFNLKGRVYFDKLALEEFMKEVKAFKG